MVCISHSHYDGGGLSARAVPFDLSIWRTVFYIGKQIPLAPVQHEQWHLSHSHSLHTLEKERSWCDMPLRTECLSELSFLSQLTFCLFSVLAGWEKGPATGTLHCSPFVCLPGAFSLPARKMLLAGEGRSGALTRVQHVATH